MNIKDTEKSKNTRNQTVGDGVIVLHGTRLDVDKSARISDIMVKLDDIISRVEALETEVFG